MAFVVLRAESMQYDGSNAEAIAAWVGAEIVSVVDGVLTLSVTMDILTYEQVLHPGWWILRQDGGSSGTYSPERYAQLWVELDPSAVAP